MSFEVQQSLSYFSHSFNQYILSAKYKARCWGYNSEKKPIQTAHSELHSTGRGSPKYK